MTNETNTQTLVALKQDMDWSNKVLVLTQFVVILALAVSIAL